MPDLAPPKPGDWYSLSHLSSVWQHLTEGRLHVGKREPPVGVDGMRAEHFARHFDANASEILRRIHQREASGETRYRFAPLLAVERAKPNGSVRLVHIPRLRDQIVLRMIHEELGHALSEAGWSTRTESPSVIVDRLRDQISTEQPSFALKADLSQFFSSVPRAKVLEALGHHNLHPLTRALLETWSRQLTIRPAWSIGKARDHHIDGLPQGVSVAASLAEFWASKLDRALSGAGLRFHRYVDDLLLLAATESECDRALGMLAEHARELGLRLSADKTRVSPLSEGVTWLGLTHFPEHVEIDAVRREHWTRRIASLRRRAGARIAAAADADERLAAVLELVQVLKDETRSRRNFRVKWYAHVSDVRLWDDVDASIRHAICSAYRQARIAMPTHHAFPSVVKNMHRIRSAAEGVRHIADQGPCAITRSRGTAEQGLKAPLVNPLPSDEPLRSRRD
jgi:hypothetical protein